MIYIIGGNKKKAKIQIPQDNVRPTSSHKREAVFSIIKSYEQKINYNILNDNIVLDLFAGSGSLGLEAISRGARYCYFFDYNINVNIQ